MKISNKKLKVLIINYEFPPLGGGGGVASYDLALEWEKHGQVDVLTSNFSGLEAYKNVNGINVYRTKIFFRKSRDAATFLSMLSFLLTGFIEGFKLCRKNRYDVINTHFAVPSGPLGYILGRMFGIPNVLSLHGGDIYDPSKKMSPHKSKIFSRVVKFILNRADRIVAQSSNTRDNTIKYYNPVKEVEIIPLAFHPPVIVKSSREKLGLDKDSFYFITIGRLVKRKSIETILQALSGISNKKIKLLVVGDGPEMEFLQSMAASLNLTERVTFPGYIADEEKYSFLKNSDAFILTSLHEGFGIVFMEAMFTGLPIVCTNHGGQVDFLTDKENALLIDVGDVESCRKSMLKIYKDSSLYNLMSKNNKKKVKNFYAESVAAEYLKIFNEIKK
ncbi:MAG TPA: glycosyltransferase family 4 protein [Spirochaetota bacterium]|nr:glycosyltransferase family 4 protein [Spirochaetota bacterium]